MSSHHLNQYWVIFNWTHRKKLLWILNQDTIIFIQENTSQKVVCKRWPFFFSSLNVLRQLPTEKAHIFKQQSYKKNMIATTPTYNNSRTTYVCPQHDLGSTPIITPPFIKIYLKYISYIYSNAECYVVVFSWEISSTSSSWKRKKKSLYCKKLNSLK